MVKEIMEEIKMVYRNLPLRRLAPTISVIDGIAASLWQNRQGQEYS